jgi:hypothetical protein
VYPSSCDEVEFMESPISGRGFILVDACKTILCSSHIDILESEG